jgi:hypothetical protein
MQDLSSRIHLKPGSISMADGRPIADGRCRFPGDVFYFFPNYYGDIDYDSAF